MTFDIREFIRANKAIFIWLGFGALLYLFRNLFALVFLTFIMCFVSGGIISQVKRWGPANRRFMVVLVYCIFLLLLGVVIAFFIPRLITEARAFTELLPGVVRVIISWVDGFASSSPFFLNAVAQMKEFLTPEQLIIQGWALLWAFLELGLLYLSWFVAALFFSFLIMLDLPRLKQSALSLRATRIASAYDETAESIVMFATVVGENFRAQIIISALDTLLTVIGLFALGVDGIALLATLVFLCGLIPVLGGFISSIPIFLMAVNTGGISLGIWSMVMVAGVSLSEMYIFNPRIVSRIMRINPVMTLIILYSAYSMIGIWGFLLGVPISVYIYRQITAPKALPAPPALPEADTSSTPHV